MSTQENTADLKKKPIWYLFLLANVLVVLGCAITWILIAKPIENNTLLMLPTLICNVLSIVACGFFVWIEAKNTMPQQMHFQKKWLKFYLAALILFGVAIMFSTVFFILTTTNVDTLMTQQWARIVYITVTGVFSLVAIGLQRYARYRIDLDIIRRRHGEEIKQEAEKKAKEEKEKPAEPVKPSQVDKPTGGLLDKME